MQTQTFDFPLPPAEKYRPRGCGVLEFSSYGMRSELGMFLSDVWHKEGGNGNAPDFECVTKDNCNNVRGALMALEIELLAA